MNQYTSVMNREFVEELNLDAGLPRRARLLPSREHAARIRLGGSLALLK